MSAGAYLVPMDKTMLRRALRVAPSLGLGLGVLVAGCAKKAAPDPSTEKPTAAASVNAAPAVASLGSNSPTPPGSAGRVLLTLEDRLGAERERKVEGTARADDVYKAIERAGITLTDRKQHVASVFGALYCLGARGTGDLAFSVCEYETAEAAAKGKEGSIKAFEAVPNRELVVVKKTLLTVRQPAVKTPASEAAAKKAVDAFKAM